MGLPVLPPDFEFVRGIDVSVRAKKEGFWPKGNLNELFL